MKGATIVLLVLLLLLLLAGCQHIIDPAPMPGAGSPGMVIESPQQKALIATAQAIGNTAEARRVYLEKTKGGAP